MVLLCDQEERLPFMKIVPIKDLKDTAKISLLCHESDEPIFVTRNGYADMVVMSAEHYDRIEKYAQSSEAALLVQQGISSIEKGECSDAFEVLGKMRRRYGL